MQFMASPWPSPHGEGKERGAKQAGFKLQGLSEVAFLRNERKNLRL